MQKWDLIFFGPAVFYAPGITKMVCWYLGQIVCWSNASLDFRISLTLWFRVIYPSGMLIFQLLSNEIGIN